MYIIKFYQNGVIEDKSFTDDFEFKIHDVIEVDKKDMFSWIEVAKEENIKLMVLEAECICDLS